MCCCCCLQVALNISVPISSGCTMLIPHERVQCLVPPGVGPGITWQVIVEGLASPVLLNQSSSYGPPIIYTMSPPLGSGSGGHYVTLTGQQLGYPGIPAALVALTLGGFPIQQVNVVSGCTVQFFLPPGEGGNLPLLLIIGGVTALMSNGQLPTYSYAIPVINSVQLYGKQGELSQLAVYGSGFGNAPALPAAGNTPPLISGDVGSVSTRIYLYANDTVLDCPWVDIMSGSLGPIPFSRTSFACLSTVTDANMTVVAGNQSSNPFTFTRDSLQIRPAMNATQFMVPTTGCVSLAAFISCGSCFVSSPCLVV